MIVTREIYTIPLLVGLHDIPLLKACQIGNTFILDYKRV